jgi:putative oxidoreductase
MEKREMEWKRLVHFALQGSSGLEQYAILLICVLIGLFFAISGANKLFAAGGTKPVYDTLVKARVPFPHQTAYFVAGVEFVCGSLVTVGFLSSPTCVALLIDMIVATLTSALSTLPEGLSPLNWLDDFLYLPYVSPFRFIVAAPLHETGGCCSARIISIIRPSQRKGTSYEISDALSRYTDRWALHFLQRGRSERRADTPSAAWASIIVAHVRAALLPVVRSLPSGRS